MRVFSVYRLNFTDDTIYIGYSGNLKKRIEDHRSKWELNFTVDVLAEFRSIYQAMEFEDYMLYHSKLKDYDKVRNNEPCFNPHTGKWYGRYGEGPFSLPLAP